jgi:catechol 2,3-dioxygenase-like lactoylglutathione lyase family enzyme
MTTNDLIRLDYVVLRCADLARSRRFYEALGLRFEEQQHGRGAPHLSANIGGVVLELYPLSTRSSAGLRFGLRVQDLALVLDGLARVESSAVVRIREDGPGTALLRDPDGHEVELSQL